VRHGFKARAERLSAKAREELGLSPAMPLDPWAYAEHLGVLVLDFAELEVSPECRYRLLRADQESWSGMTLREAGTTAILVNPSHARVRQCSTLMHELAHFILKHVPARVDVSASGMLLLSEYSEDSEAEADWLAAAMLLPREVLMRLRRRGASVSEIAAAFGTSEQLCEWRLRMTGVDVQLRRMATR
jgi:Zn-dependent peptidase ImmA (M78 family)